MHAFTIDISGGTIQAIAWGNGKQLLVCLHGFGEEADSFACLEDFLGDRFTIVAFDLPLHGDTKWKKAYMEEKDLYECILHLLSHFNKQRFSLLGYSMGGRISLFATQHFAEKMDQLLLVAPDGLRYNPWFLFATQIRPGRYLFRWNIYHPKLFFTLLKTGKFLRIVNQSLYKFVFQYMNNEEKRLQVYQVWTCMKDIMPDTKKVKKMLLQYQIPSLLFFGKYDRVIPPSLADSFCNGLQLTTVIVLDKGHNLLSKELGKLIREKTAVQP
jgi:pimeloyl-ACP methyl ester carboxylesterase